MDASRQCSKLDRETDSEVDYVTYVRNVGHANRLHRYMAPVFKSMNLPYHSAYQNSNTALS